MDKKTIWIVLGAILPYVLVTGGIIFVFLAIVGGDADKPVPIPCTDPKAREYYAMYLAAGSPWDLVILVDLFLTDTNGNKDLEDTNPLITSLNFNLLETTYYKWVWDEDEEGNRLDTGEWRIDRESESQGFDEIRSTLAISQNTTAAELTLAIKNYDEEYYEEDKRKRETKISGVDPTQYRSIIEKYYGELFTERQINDIMDVHASKYLHFLYEDSIGIYDQIFGPYDPDAPAPPPRGSFASPIAGNWPDVVSCEFGGYPGHTGIDLAIPNGTPIYAAKSGTVTKAKRGSTGYGYYVAIDHGDSTGTLYAHCSELLVQDGQEVSKGDMIALSGNTGNSTGPHLHFEIIINRIPQDPRDHL